MDESYLMADSKGIVPMDFETKVNYLFRAMELQEIKSDRKAQAVFRQYLEKNNSWYIISETPAPKGAYNLMRAKFDCDVDWVPYFRTKGIGVIGKAKDLLSLGGGKCYSYYNHKFQMYVPAVLAYGPVTETDIAVHEFIHAVRRNLETYKGPERVISELFAESDCIIPIHEVFFRYPLITAETHSNMRKVRKKLKNCFGDKVDYAFIRLKKQDVESLSESKKGEKEVKEYFKHQSSYHNEGLRFQIMCEKLGL